jgi:hypothetical protein
MLDGHISQWGNPDAKRNGVVCVRSRTAGIEACGNLRDRRGNMR